jgi:N-acetylglutamate synthase-like GNAT family acetyltransferase
VTHDWPRFAEIDDLRHAVLLKPFEVERDDDWNDEDPASRHLVALVGGLVAGYGRLIFQGGPVVQIRQVTVRPDLERRGIGRAMMEALIEHAGESGADQVWLNARASAEGFYLRLGFQTIGDVFPSPRTYLPHVRMEYRPDVR